MFWNNEKVPSKLCLLLFEGTSRMRGVKVLSNIQILFKYFIFISYFVCNFNFLFKFLLSFFSCDFSPHCIFRIKLKSYWNSFWQKFHVLYWNQVNVGCVERFNFFYYYFCGHVQNLIISNMGKLFHFFLKKYLILYSHNTVSIWKEGVFRYIFITNPFFEVAFFQYAKNVFIADVYEYWSFVGCGREKKYVDWFTVTMYKIKQMFSNFKSITFYDFLFWDYFYFVI